MVDKAVIVVQAGWTARCSAGGKGNQGDGRRRIIGVVLNRADAQASSNGDYYYQHYAGDYFQHDASDSPASPAHNE